MKPFGIVFSKLSGIPSGVKHDMPSPEELPPGGVPPEEAVAFFRSKGFRIGFNWQDVFKAEHVRAFTVAKAMSRDILEDIRAAVDKAIAEGTTLETFKAELRPTLEAKGWWGKKVMLDPATGQHELVQLGSPRRLKTIFDTNVRTAYQAGKWERIQRTKKAFPFLEYSSVMDGRERPEHHDWDGTILPVDDPWWDTHYGPCDWNCRCTAIPRSQRMLDRMGRTVDDQPPPANDLLPWTNSRTGETGMLEAGIGKGWDYNVGKEYLRGLAPSPLPESFDQGPDEVGASARLSSAQSGLIDRFLKAFGIAPGGEAIWMDKEGWPLSIGRGWFIAPGGRVQLPGGAAGVAIDRIAAAIVQPDRIGWGGVRGRNGRRELMRRYARTSAGITTLVDVGRDGWRWVSGRASEIAAAYDPHQARDRNGRWTSGHALAIGFATAASSGDAPTRHRLGPVSDHARAQLTRLGLRADAKSVELGRDDVRHILKRHGRDSRGQKPIGAEDIANARTIFNRGIISHGTPRLSRSGSPMVFVSAKVGGHDYSAAFQIGKHRVKLTSLRKR